MILRLIAAALIVPLVAVAAAKLTQKGAAVDGRSYGIDMVAGEATFASICSSCHSVVPGSGSRTGPNLAEIGKLASTRRPGMSAVDYIVESVVFPTAFKPPGASGEMPENLHGSLSPRQFGNLIAFLAAQGGAKPDFLAITKLPKQVVKEAVVAADAPTRAQLEHGEAVFRGKGGCINCHHLEVGAEYRIQAPALFSAGLRDLKQIHESIVEPSRQVDSAYEESTIAMADGTILNGRILFQTPESLAVLTTDPQGGASYVNVPLDQVEREGESLVIQKSENSPMPSGLGDSLTPEELENLIHFVASLN